MVNPHFSNDSSQLYRSDRSDRVDILTTYIDQILAGILDCQTSPCVTNVTILGSDHTNLMTMIQEVQEQGEPLTPALFATLELILGREDYAQAQFQAALEHYENSLKFWRAPITNPSLHLETSEHFSPDYFLERLGVVLFHIGLNYVRLGEFNPKDQVQDHRQDHWQSAHTNLQGCLSAFEQANRLDLVAKFIGSLIDILCKLEDWEKVKLLAQRALNLHLSYGSAQQIAQDYGWLAEAALNEFQWSHASQLAELAFEIQQQSLSNSFVIFAEDSPYLLLLAKSKQELVDRIKTTDQLEEALQNTALQKDTQAYVQVLKALRKLYSEQSEYGKASHLKEEQLRVEYQYQLRSFVGVRQLQPQVQSGKEKSNIANEILHSDRLLDVYTLVNRIQSRHHRLIVLHGQSGVGKSSLLSAGVIPSLLHRQLSEEGIAIPVLLRVYTDWLRDPDSNTWNLREVFKLLEKNCDRQLPTVLIFDQFEEFFLVCTEISQRLPFYQFLKRCLSLEFVTVLLAMRTDYLHYLLECDRRVNLAEILPFEVLSQHVLYGLENFSLEQTKKFIQNQMATSSIQFDQDLVQQIVQDLSHPLDEICPIELQIVGSQLQTNKITTLEQYQHLGDSPKQTLLNQYLDQMIEDCSYQNERAVISVLYALTGENGARPVKTYPALQSELEIISHKLDLVLEILVESGLVLLLPDVPDDRYQLAHDYLVTLIRQQQGERRITELEFDRNKAQRQVLAKKPNSLVDRAISSVLKWVKVD
ncbi:MAG: hypothetical protein ACRC8A_17945 [Microcoleaceae cyanobacterium]